MSSGTSVPTIEESLTKIRAGDQEREALIRSLATVQERHGASVRDLEVLAREMTDLNTSPASIQTDVTAERERLARDAQQYTEGLAELRRQIEAAEQAQRDQS